MLRVQERDGSHFEGLGALHDDRMAVAHYPPVEGRQDHQLTARDLADLAARASTGADQRPAVDRSGRNQGVALELQRRHPVRRRDAALDGVVAYPGRRDEVVAEPAPRRFGVGVMADDVETDIAERVRAEAGGLLVPVHHIVHEDDSAALHGREPETCGQRLVDRPRPRRHVAQEHHSAVDDQLRRQKFRHGAPLAAIRTARVYRVTSSRAVCASASSSPWR